MKRYGGIGTAVVFLLVGAAVLFRLMPKAPLLDNYVFSSAIYDRHDKLLRLNLSRDDKYRLKVSLAEVPDSAKEALLLYEDRWFYYHPGINPLRLAKAVLQMAAGGRKQGASTITMQVARQIYHIDSSTLIGKAEQILRALQLEAMYSKDEILEAYFNISPYGGNIEGIGAAALIYFGSDVQKLNILQSIMLTVIPQNPGRRALLTVSGIQQAEAAAKRLKKQWRQAYPQTDHSVLNLPLQPKRHLPFIAPHLMQRFKEKTCGKIVTTIDASYQQMLEDVMRRFIKDNRIKGVENAAAMIIDYKKNEVLATVGSADFFNRRINGQVDGTKALRSPGSVLKPFIYALALDEGLIHPLSVLKDVPRNYGLYTPENFDHSFYGLVNATEALVNSRNVPAVDLLKALKKDRFYHLLQQIGVRNLQSSGFYGLALALGGAEVTMEDVASLYALLGNYGKFVPPAYLRDEKRRNPEQLISAEAAYLTLKMLAQNPPPDDEKLPYQAVGDKYQVYWKTGTSYGFRDAWTAGLAGDYVVVVWIGNFDGMPNNNFVGRKIATPLFFKIIRKLNYMTGLRQSILDAGGLNIRQVDICENTGDLADDNCAKKTSGDFIPGVTRIKMSNVSRMIPINIATGKRACRHQPPLTKLKRFDFWPSDVQEAFAAAGINIKQPPSFEETCLPHEATTVRGCRPKIIFPAADSIILLRSKHREKMTIPLRASADADATKIYWFINNRLVGEVRPGETMATRPKAGENFIKAVDNFGREQEISIRVKFID